MTEKARYLYCIIKESKPKKFEIKGVEGGDVYAISESKLSAVVSDSEIKEYSLFRENTLTHQRVIEEVMKEYDVLPVSFGTVAESEKDVKEKILKPRAEDLLNALEKIKGKVELNLKAIWLDMPSVFREIVKENKEIQFAEKEASKVSGIERTNFAIEIGKMVASALERKKEKEANEICKSLKKIAEDFKENKAQPDQVIFNSAFLVLKKKEREFDKEISNLGEKYDKRIKFFYVGSLPPYNFIYVHY